MILTRELCLVHLCIKRGGIESLCLNQFIFKLFTDYEVFPSAVLGRQVTPSRSSVWF